jgi:hypothetical protein
MCEQKGPAEVPDTTGPPHSGPRVESLTSHLELAPGDRTRTTGTHGAGGAWPELRLDEWQETCTALHLRLQIVGKVRLACSPWLNHSWHATTYVTSCGLSTSPIPHGERTFEIEFDLIDHVLHIRVSDGSAAALALEPQPVATFHRRLMDELARLGIAVRIHGGPNEMAEAIRFDSDRTERPYDSDFANRFWRALVQADRVLKEFRARFVGKCSPVHLFWGGLDLAVTRFSGRRAPVHPGGIPNLPDWVTREAYSHEVSSCGFWPGGGAIPYAAFYAYAYPEPEGFATARVTPDAAFYSADLREFILPYDAVRSSISPDATLLGFLQSTYEAAADLGAWDRGALEWNADDSKPGGA